jgi:hypothetical protein
MIRRLYAVSFYRGLSPIVPTKAQGLDNQSFLYQEQE